MGVPVPVAANSPHASKSAQSGLAVKLAAFKRRPQRNNALIVTQLWCTSSRAVAVGVFYDALFSALVVWAVKCLF
jgi:hypothetical protein